MYIFLKKKLDIFQITSIEEFSSTQQPLRPYSVMHLFMAHAVMHAGLIQRRWTILTPAAFMKI